MSRNGNKAVVTISNNTAKVTSKTSTAKVSTSAVSNSTSPSTTNNKAITSVVDPRVIIGGVDNGAGVPIDGSLAYKSGKDIEITPNNIINFIGDEQDPISYRMINDDGSIEYHVLGFTEGPATESDLFAKQNIFTAGTGLEFSADGLVLNADATINYTDDKARLAVDITHTENSISYSDKDGNSRTLNFVIPSYTPPAGAQPLTWAELATELYIDNAFGSKVDKDGNKVLSEEDFTTTLKNKLENLDLTSKADQTALNTTNAAVALNTAKPKVPALPALINDDTSKEYNLKLTDVDGTETLSWTEDTGAVAITDSLTSDVATDALSANQGKVLKTAVDLNTAKPKVPSLPELIAEDSSKEYNLKLTDVDGTETLTWTEDTGAVTITDNLTSDVITDALSANQGKVLKTAVDLNTEKPKVPSLPALIDDDSSKEYNLKLTDVDGTETLTWTEDPGAVTITDSLTSDVTTDALSANQGKVLKTAVDLNTEKPKVPALPALIGDDSSKEYNLKLTDVDGTETLTWAEDTVIDNLTSDATADALSANQGKVLKTAVDLNTAKPKVPTLPALIADDTSKEYNLKLTDVEGTETLTWTEDTGAVSITDSLTSDVTTDALSANQGKVLKTAVDLNTAKPKVPALPAMIDDDSSKEYNLKLTDVEGAETLTWTEAVAITDSLTSDVTTDALSANQGKVLKTAVDLNTAKPKVPTLPAMIGDDSSKEYNLKLTDVDGTETLTWAEDPGAVTVTDSLTSDVTTAALSAKQGKVLKTAVDLNTAKPKVPTLPAMIDDDSSKEYNLKLTDVEGTETFTWTEDTGATDLKKTGDLIQLQDAAGTAIGSGVTITTGGGGGTRKVVGFLRKDGDTITRRVFEDDDVLDVNALRTAKWVLFDALSSESFTFINTNTLRRSSIL